MWCKFAPKSLAYNNNFFVYSQQNVKELELWLKVSGLVYWQEVFLADR